MWFCAYKIKQRRTTRKKPKIERKKRKLQTHIHTRTLARSATIFMNSARQVFFSSLYFFFRFHCRSFAGVSFLSPNGLCFMFSYLYFDVCRTKIEYDMQTPIECVRSKSKLITPKRLAADQVYTVHSKPNETRRFVFGEL